MEPSKCPVSITDYSQKICWHPLSYQQKHLLRDQIKFLLIKIFLKVLFVDFKEQNGLDQNRINCRFSEKWFSLKQCNYYNNERLQCFTYTLLLKSYIYTVVTSGSNWLMIIHEVIFWAQSITGVTRVFKGQHVAFFPLILRA